MKILNKIFIATVLLTVLASVSSVSAEDAAPAKEVTVKGSDTMVILAQKWAEVYMSKHADVKVQVTGGGSGTGFAALQNKATDIANASRPIKREEKAACIKAFNAIPREYIVAIDGLSVFVNKESKIKEMDMGQLKDIFTGKITNWKDVGGDDAVITIYSRENSSGTYEYFKEHVLQKTNDFAASAQTMQGTAALLQAVANDPNGIGYGGKAYGGGAKAIAVKKDAASPGIEPTEENVVSKTYPIWRYLYDYINPALDTGATHDYLEWIRTDEGQAIVKDIGYYPLPEEMRVKK